MDTQRVAREQNKMKTSELEKAIIGSLKEILRDSDYLYYSSVGPDYCHLTVEGSRVILELVNMLGPRLINAMAQEDIDRSKELVFNELKGK